MARPVRVRVAPSPTGDPHVGTAWIALFNHAFAKKEGGRFILRIEDTDQKRSTSESEKAIFDALRWVGLTWDEGPDVGGDYGPYRQSERTEHYVKYVTELVAGGHAYRCFCSSERLDKVRKEREKAKQTGGYDRKCREVDPAEAASRASAGESHTIRLRVPDEKITYNDLFREPVTFDAIQIDDQILLKSDGFPTYHLANVVDDHLMEITHVIRGEEWINSTPKHVLLYRAFGWEQPVWAHMPLLRNNDKNKSKISKRANPVSIGYYRDIGVLPEAFLNFLGILGWSFGDDREIFSLEEMIEVFSLERVSLGGPVFNLDKLKWMNEQYIHRLSDDELADQLVEWRLGRDFFRQLAPLMRERIKLLSDFVPGTSYFFSNDLDYTNVADKLNIPDVTPKDLKKGLLALLDAYDALPGFEAGALEAASREFADAKGWKTGKLFMVLRLAISGRKASPPLFDTMVALGKELTRHRIRSVANQLAAFAAQKK